MAALPELFKKAIRFVDGSHLDVLQDRDTLRAEFAGKAAMSLGNLVPDGGGGAAEKSVPGAVVYLVRHGETALNKGGASGEDRIRGWANVPLDEEGVAEAARLGQEFAGQKLGAIVSSDLSRAQHTADAISKTTGCRVEKSWQLRPWNLGVFQGKVAKDVHPVIVKQVESAPDKPIEGGESFNAFKGRYLGAIRRVMLAAEQRKQPVVVVTHFRNVKLTEGWLDGGVGAKDDVVSPDTFFRNDLPTGAVVELRSMGDGNWSYRRLDFPGEGKKFAVAAPPAPRDVQHGQPADQFHQWFGASAVRDEAGAPKVVHHGTGYRGFRVFDPNKTNHPESERFGPALYFTEEKGVARKYAGQNKTGASPEVKDVYLHVHKPFDADAPLSEDDAVRIAKDLPTWVGPLGEDRVREGYRNLSAVLGKEHAGAKVTGEHFYRHLAQHHQVPKAAINESLAKAGYDGIKHTGVPDGDQQWVAFHPNQVKSVDNVGSFDPKKERIDLSEWREELHPRGEPDNAGEFAPKGQATEQPKAKPAQKPVLPPELKAKIARATPGHGRAINLSKDEVKQVLDAGLVGFVSAGRNPNSDEDKQMSDAEIAERHHKLQDRLVELGCKFVPVHGKYGAEEDSFLVMVPEVSREEAVALGREFNQDSVIYAEHGKNEMIFTTGANAGNAFVGQGWQPMPDADDFYSELRTQDGATFKFQLHFNFDDMVKLSRQLQQRIADAWEPRPDGWFNTISRVKLPMDELPPKD